MADGGGVRNAGPVEAGMLTAAWRAGKEADVIVGSDP
jgi:hypothetical protein